MCSTRIVVLVLVSMVAGNAAHAQLALGPKDGAGLLDYCRAEEIVRQPPQTRALLSQSRYEEVLNKYYWCLGYVEARMDAATQAQATLEVASQSGVSLSGPSHESQVFTAMLQMACFPATAEPNSVIIALNRWLSEHPNRLHESIAALTGEAFQNMFPCRKVSPKNEEKTTPPVKK